MKRTIVSVFVVIIFVELAVGQTADKAVAYNDKIIDMFAEINRDYEALLTTYEGYIPAQMDSTFNVAVRKTKVGINKLEKMPPYMSDSSLRNEAIKLFEVILSTLELEQQQIIKLLKLPEADYGSNEVEKLDKLRNLAYKKIDEAENRLSKIQEKFAATHKFSFEKSE